MFVHINIWYGMPIREFFFSKDSWFLIKEWSKLLYFNIYNVVILDNVLMITWKLLQFMLVSFEMPFFVFLFWQVIMVLFRLVIIVLPCLEKNEICIGAANFNQKLHDFCNFHATQSELTQVLLPPAVSLQFVLMT